MLLKLGLVLLMQFGFIAGVYVPNESANKPVYTAGLKTTNSKTSYPVIHQNYSHINYQKHTSAQTIDKIYEQVFDQQIDNTHNFDQQIDNGRNVDQQIDNTQSFDQQVDNGHNFDQQDFGYRRPQKYQRTSNSDHYHHSSNLRPTNYFSGQSVHHKSQTQINSQPMSQCPPGETGQFVYEASCNQFLNCWKGRGVPQNCAPGTLFNPLTLECDCADKVQCVSSPRNLPSEPITHKQQAHCPSGFSGIIPYYENCSKFINCDNGREHIMDCPPGTLFSVKNNLCDFPYKVDCVNGDEGKGEECGPGGCQTGHNHGHGYYYGLKPSGQNYGKFDDGQYRGEEQGYNSGQYSGGYRGGRYDDGQYRGENQYQGQNSGQYSGGNQGGRYDDGQYREEHHNKGRKFDDGQYRGENQGQNSGQYQGQNSGQYQGQYSGQNQGQNSGQNQGQNSGQYLGQNSGQNQGQNSGQYQGQYSGQNQGQNSGQYQGQNSGQYQGQYSGQNQGQSSGQYQGQVSPNSRPSQTGQTSKQYGTNAQNSWSGQSQSSGGQTSASQIQTTHQASTVQQKGASSLPKSQDLRPKCPPGHTGLMKHPTICAKFLNCNHGQTFIQDCGPGTVFNPAISACDFPHNVNCKNVVETNSGSYSGSNSGSNSGKGTQTGTYTSTNSGSYSGYNSGQGSQSYSGAISGSHSGANSGQGSYSGSNSGTYSGSNSGQGSYSGANSGSHSGTNLGQGTHSGSNSGSYSGSNSGFPFNTNSGFPSTTNSGSYSGSNSGTGSGSNFGQGSNLNGHGQYAGHGWHSGTHSGQNYRPGNGHSAVYHGQGSSGFVGASGQGQNATKPGFSTNGKYSSGYQGSNVQSSVKGTLLSAKNEHVYGQRPHIEEEVGNEQGLDGNPSNQPQVGNQEGFGHHHHDHNHSSFDGPGHHGHHHHHQHSDFRGPEFGNNQHQHQHHHHHHNHPNFEGPGSGHQHQHQHNHHSNHGTNFEDFGHHHNFSQGRHPHSNFNVQTVDNQNFYQVTENPESSTRSSFKSKHAPPPFPSTDVNADYVFEYEDLDEGNVGASKAVDNWCDSKGFECGNKVCVAPSKVCDGKKECPNGRDEEDCFQYYSGFVKIGGTKLAVKEMQKTANITCLWCSKLCALNTKCKAFNYRAMDGTCYLLNSNIGLSGALILLENYDYYESKNQSIDCSQGYECRNKKCISKKQVCNGLNDCGDGLDEKGCKAEAFAYSLHLVGGNNKHSGNLEVHAFNKKGFICDDMFGLRNADVACRELGFPLGALEVKGNSFFAPNANTSFYMMDDITCLGNETSLRDCDFNGWGAHNCGPLEIVGVVCKTPQETCPADHWQCDTGKECLLRTFLCDGIYDCTDGSDEDSKYCEAPISIRLVNGTSADNGRVEIRYKGVWGSICDDDFNDDAAKVVCRQLGFKGSGYAKKDGFYGPGSGPIWLDQVFCSGNEDSVANCTHWEWGENNCEHTEDVGVICSNFDTSGKPRHLQDVPDVKLAKGPILPKKCGMRSDDMFSEPSDVHFRVVRGSLAQQGHYPWQASIRVKGKTRATHWCGAIVISPSFVLTAAHCLIGFSKGAYYVVAGDYNVDTVEGTEQEAFIEDFILHENFRVGTKMNNDIAVVKLKGKGFELTKAVQAICLPEADTSYERRNCTISGFGSIESGKSKSSKDLRAGWLPILPIEVCKMPHIYGESITQGMFCAGSLDEGVDACDGDSGGPFACLKDGAFTLYGITSWGQHCGYANKPGVYVKVAHYRSWIDKTLQKLINT